MRIAVVGKSGSGKSYTTAMLIESCRMKGFVHINVDEQVKALYEERNSAVLDYIKSNGRSPKTFINDDGSINIIDWGVFILSCENARLRFEDFLYENFFKPALVRLSTADVIIDGLMPRFLTKDIEFDQVIYITAPLINRVANLTNRKVSINRIKEIFAIQQDLFGDIDDVLLP